MGFSDRRTLVQAGNSCGTKVKYREGARERPGAFRQRENSPFRGVPPACYLIGDLLRLEAEVTRGIGGHAAEDARGREPQVKEAPGRLTLDNTTLKELLKNNF